MSESGKYEMELQSMQELNHMTPSHPPSHDAVSEIELPPSPGANTSCPPYNTNSLFPDKGRGDDFSVSDSFSGMWRRSRFKELSSLCVSVRDGSFVVNAQSTPKVISGRSKPLSKDQK